MNILYIAEITGKAGVWLVKTQLSNLKEKYEADFVIANANSATGSGGLGKQHAVYLKKLGVDCITSGDLIFQKKDLVDDLHKTPHVLRPFNLPSESPGQGWKIFNLKKNKKIAVVSAIGRIGRHKIMAENPFTETEKLISQLKEEADLIFVDFSSFATAEKQALGFLLSGKVSALIGSGTRVQTADECILENKTAYITDAGRTGSLNSVGGYAIEDKIREYRTCLPDFGKDAWARPALQGLFIKTDDDGNTIEIKRIFEESELCKETE